MINRKGDLFENVGSTIIAVIGLTLILFAAWKLYSVYISQEETNAQRFIDSLMGKIELLEEGQANKFVFAGVSKEENKWSLWGWSKIETGRPDKCSFKSCICICPTGFRHIGQKQESIKNNAEIRDVCQEKGFCRFFDQKDLVVESTQNTYRVGGGDVGGGRFVKTGTKTADGIFLPTNLIELEIKKSEDSVSVGASQVSSE